MNQYHMSEDNLTIFDVLPHTLQCLDHAMPCPALPILAALLALAGNKKRNNRRRFS